MKCPRCQRDHPPHAKSCLECGTPLRDVILTERSSADLQAEIDGLRRELGEAREQQTATAEILRVISSSPTNIQAVLATVSERAARLCDSYDAAIFLVDGDTLRLVAHHGPIPPTGSTAPLVRGFVNGRVVLERRGIHLADLQAETDEFPEGSAEAQRVGWRTTLAVPLMRENTVIGTIAIRRTEVRPFSMQQIDLLKTFADQAVIAIENVRLFSETKEALDQQTSTGEILRVISQSQTDVQPVFDTIAANARRLCNASSSAVFTFDGELIHLAAQEHMSPQGAAVVRGTFPMPPGRGSTAARAIMTRSIAQITEAREDPEYVLRNATEILEFRSVLAVPMLRDGHPIGAVSVGKAVTGPFPDKQIALLQTFADQAVIAIENVRLFTELEEKNRALTQAHGQVTEALEQQTATSEILRVISSSHTDLQPVFGTILQSAGRLCDATFGALQLFDGEELTLDGHYGISPEDVAMLQAEVFPMRPDVGSSIGRAIIRRATVHIEDIRSDPQFKVSTLQTREGYRTALSVPMLRGGVAIGVINLWRRDVRPFSQTHIDMVQTFADQAVIAIENVRLFTELDARNRELGVALEQQTATSELLKVIGRSTFDLQPVFETLAENAVRLCEGRATILRFDGQVLRMVVSHNVSVEAKEFFERNPLVPGRHSAAARAALEQRTIHIHDIRTEPEYTYGTLTVLDTVRTVLALPMLRANELLGVIVIYRDEVQPFTEGQIALMETFADQAAIAIENARLLTELQARTQDLTRSVDQLTALAEVGRAVSSTLDLEMVLTTIVSRAVDLSGLDGGVVSEYDEAAEEFVQRAVAETGGILARALRGVRYRKGEGALGRTAITREPVQVPDITVPGAYDSRVRENLIESGIRAVLAVPMIHQDRLIGCLGVTRNQPGEFSTETIDLLRTFATQSALAIQNARLFQELANKSRELEAASQHKSEFLANMSHELRTPLNAIIGFSEVLSDRMFGELNEKQEEYLKDIHASGQHLLSLINDILDLSKIEAGRMELELTDFNLPVTLDNALTLVRERAGRRGIALGLTIDVRLEQIRADERKIRQVVLNLLSNAIKFTPEGGRIQIRAVPVDGMVEISVSDTGVGIAPEDQEAIFEEFRQVGTAAKKVEGTGLGLALSRKFVELHGGRIWVTSQVGVGSTFTFTIPVRSGK
jgi:signal transduction histidine kinase